MTAFKNSLDLIYHAKYHIRLKPSTFHYSKLMKKLNQNYRGEIREFYLHSLIMKQIKIPVLLFLKGSLVEGRYLTILSHSLPMQTENCECSFHVALMQACII